MSSNKKTENKKLPINQFVEEKKKSTKLFYKTNVTNISNVIVKKQQKLYLSKGLEYHNLFEEYLKTAKIPELKDENQKKIFSQFLSFLDHMKYLKIDKVEFGLSSIINYNNITLQINGRIDAIFVEKPDKYLYDPNNVYIIDWKLSSSISHDLMQQYNVILNIYANFYKEKFPEAKIKMYLVLLSELNHDFKLIEIKSCSNNSLFKIINQLSEDEFKSFCNNFEQQN